MTSAARPLITLTRRLPRPVEERLEATYETRVRGEDVPMSADELADAMRTSDAVVPTISDRITREVLTASPRRARIIAQFGVGVNNIDLEAARSAGIVVTNTPGVLTEDTADLTIALILMTARRLSEGERELRTGRWTGWRPTYLLGTRVRDLTLGIIGFGRIGRAVAVRAYQGLGMRIIAYNPSPTDPRALHEAHGRRCGSVEALLQESDVVSLHCPATPETRHLINDARLRLMKRTAFLINTARGDVVDEDALATALREGVIAGAGLDVFEAEPAVHPGLLELANVTLLPHLGSATLETRTAMGMRVVDNLGAFFEGRDPPDRVV